MDLQKTGNFIAQQRKAKNLTQAKLAEKLHVSEKTVSKWECGNGFPDTSLIMPLCEALEISANELLSAEKINDNQYKEYAEHNLVTLQAKNTKNTKHSNYNIKIRCNMLFCNCCWRFELCKTTSKQFR